MRTCPSPLNATISDQVVPLLGLTFTGLPHRSLTATEKLTTPWPLFPFNWRASGSLQISYDLDVVRTQHVIPSF